MARMNGIQAGEYVGLSSSMLEKLRTAGGGPRFMKVGRRVVYDSADLDQWIESKKQASTADLPELRGRQRNKLR